MMNGQLGTGVIEGVWRKLKGTLPAKRTFTMLVMACLRVASELSDHVMLFRDKIEKSLDTLVKEQLDPKGKRKDDSTYIILKRAHLKCSMYAIREIEKRLLLLPNAKINAKCDVVTERTPTGEYQFQPRRTTADGKWKCTAVDGGGMCWSNCLYGLPCRHILLVWAEELKYGEEDQVYYSLSHPFLNVQFIPAHARLPLTRSCTSTYHPLVNVTDDRFPNVGLGDDGTQALPP